MTIVIVFDEPHPNRTRSIQDDDGSDKGTDDKQMVIPRIRPKLFTDNGLAEKHMFPFDSSSRRRNI